MEYKKIYQFLVFLGVCSRALYGQELPPQPVPPMFEQNRSAAVAQESDGGLASYSIDHILKIALPFIQSESVEQFVAELRTIPVGSVDKVRKLIATLIQRELFTPNNLVLVICGAAHNFAGNKEAQANMFSLLLEYPALQQATSPIYIAANSIYAGIIPAFLAWSNEGQKHIPTDRLWLESLTDKAFMHALAVHNVKALKNMHNNGVRISREKASQLLWQAVADSKNDAIVRYLLTLGADVNYAKNGETVLRQAVRSQSLPMVKTIVGAGADLNQMVDPAVGTALQLVVAMQNPWQGDSVVQKDKQRLKRLQAIELYLRKQGAQEATMPLQ